MLRYFLKNNQFHYELKSGLLEDRADGYAVGDYKKRPNMIAIYQTVRHENVEQEMCLPMDWYSSIIVSSPGKRKEGIQIRKKNRKTAKSRRRKRSGRHSLNCGKGKGKSILCQSKQIIIYILIIPGTVMHPWRKW